jgi:hypothetical protein
MPDLADDHLGTPQDAGNWSQQSVNVWSVGFPMGTVIDNHFW